jgi:hypothetical protein
MNFFWLTDSYRDHGDEDDGERKLRRRGLRVNDRVRWKILDGNAREVVQILTGTVVAVMIPTAVDASDVWVRWDGQARPQVFKQNSATQLEVIR